jgi:adenylylsulfate kinase
MHIIKENGTDLYITSREEKEKRLRQRSKAIWLTGLSASGKTTIAINLEKELFARGFMVQILDGDNIRSGISNNLGFSNEDRYENIRRIAEVTRLFIYSGMITINSFISPTEEIREMAKRIIGKENFIEAYINAPLEICEMRDPKGLYARARSGELKEFTGLTSPFEIPENADLEVRTDLQTIEESVQQVMKYLLPLIEYKHEKTRFLSIE